MTVRQRKSQAKYRRHGKRKCGQLLYDDNSGRPTRVCIEPYGIEHDHDNAASRPVSEQGSVLTQIELVLMALTLAIILVVVALYLGWL